MRFIKFDGFLNSNLGPQKKLKRSWNIYIYIYIVFLKLTTIPT